MAAKQKASDDQIAELIKRGLTPSQIGKQLNYASSGTLTRMQKIARERGLELRKAVERRNISLDDRKAQSDFEEKLRHNARKHIDVQNGTVLVGSDAHFWAGLKSTAYKAFLKFAAELKPSAVILNGDAFDGASISRFPRIGWDSKPTVSDELKACKESMDAIEDASRTRNLYWPLGNHDSRFETHLAARAPEFQGVEGFHLKDHFPTWIPCWSVWVGDQVVVKHRYKSGIHAPHNNTVGAGKSIVTGHLHSLKVMPVSDYNGTRYGVDTGTLAEAGGPQFVDYLEDNPTNWRSGFAVLTFHKGRLLWPEVVHVIGPEEVEFRGTVISV